MATNPRLKFPRYKFQLLCRGSINVHVVSQAIQAKPAPIADSLELLPVPTQPNCLITFDPSFFPISRLKIHLKHRCCEFGGEAETTLYCLACYNGWSVRRARADDIKDHLNSRFPPLCRFVGCRLELGRVQPVAPELSRSYSVSQHSHGLRINLYLREAVLEHWVCSDGQRVDGEQPKRPHDRCSAKAGVKAPLAHQLRSKVGEEGCEVHGKFRDQ